MQSIRAQRMRKVMHIQGEVGGRKEFNVKVPDNLHEILRKSKSTNVIDMAVQDIKKKILNDDFNTFRNYDILNADTTEKKPGIAFKSMHNMYDLQTLKITKLYKKKPKTSLEEEVRKQLQQDADKQMLLCEIYEQLDEVEDGEVLKKKELHPMEESIITLKQEDQIDEAADITQWTKKLKQSKKKGLKMGGQAPPPRKSQRAVTEFIRQAVVKMDDRSPSNDSQKSIKDKLQSAFKKVKQIHELKGDLSVQKSIQQYMSRASQVMEFQSKLGEMSENQDMNKFDYSIDGVQRYYNILVKGQALEFKSESERAKFYRKQTQIILSKITEQQNLLNQQLNEKEGETQKLRVESHEIHEKLGQIKILLEQLQEELDELHQIKSPNQSKAKLDPKHSRQSLINTLMTSAQKQQELEKDIKILIDSRVAYKSKLLYNRRFLDRLDNEVYLKKKEKKKLNQSLIAFLYYLLKGGEDVRSNGIGWIITQLNRLGERVAYKTLPDFLDQKCKEYLLQKAVILNDIDILEQDQSESFKTYKQESADSSLVLAQKNLSMSQDSLEMSSLPSIFPTDSNKLSAIDLVQARQEATKSSRNNYALETLGPITLGLNHEQIEALEGMLANLNRVNVPVTNSTLIYQETQKKIKSRIMGSNQIDQSMDASSVLKEEAIRQYDKSNQQLNKIKTKLTLLDDEQVHRVAKEFDYKSYAKRFSIDPITVISCLVGGGRCDREIVKYGFKKLNDS